MRSFRRLDSFLEALQRDIYPEPVMEPHITITKQTIDMMERDGMIHPGDHVLDIGCGQGLALEIFAAKGLKVTGLTLGPDAQLCREKGFNIIKADQSFTALTPQTFDLLWCRHVLEHSIAPFFTLSEYFRLIKSGGRAYIEVPAADTCCHHEKNPNHYSIMPKSSWLELMARVGFVIERSGDINVQTDAGPDIYWAFHLRRLA